MLTNELSQRAACADYRRAWHTLKKILTRAKPPGYRQSRPRAKRKLETFLPILEQILKEDREAPKKQRHTAQWLFERLKAEHAYSGGLTVVRDAVRNWKSFTPTPPFLSVMSAQIGVHHRGKEAAVMVWAALPLRCINRGSSGSFRG